MSDETVRVQYMGTTPGADALTYVLFSTTVAFPAPGYAPANKLKRFQLGLSASAAGTLNWYKSQTRLTSTTTAPVWTQIGTAALVPSATAENTFDFLIEEYADWKLELVNGGAAQTTFLVDMALSGSRVKGT